MDPRPQTPPPPPTRAAAARSRASPARSPRSSACGPRFQLPADAVGRRLSRADAQAAFAPLSTTTFSRVALGGAALGDGAAAVVVDQLKTLVPKACLLDLSLADCVAGLQEPEAIRTLSCIATAAVPAAPGLAALDISDNPVGAKGVSALGPLLHAAAPTLRRLVIARAGINPEGVKLLRAFLPSPAALTDLVIDRNPLGTNGVTELAHIVATAPSLKSLSLVEVYQESDDVLPLLEVLADRLTTLEELVLAENPCDLDAATRLASVLDANHGLRRIDLRAVSLTDNAAYSILRSIVETPVTLSSLSIAGNGLTEATSEVLEVFVKAKGGHLVSLDLSRNRFGDDGMIRIVKALAARGPEKLEFLGAAGLGLTELGVATVAHFCKSFPVLKAVNFGPCDLRATTVDAMRSALGSKLNVAACEISVEEAKKRPGADAAGYENRLAAALVRLKRPCHNSSRGPGTKSRMSSRTVSSVKGDDGNASAASTFLSVPRSWRSGSTSYTVESQATPRNTSKSQRSGVGACETSAAASPSVDSPASNAAMVSSARQLRAQVVSLDREVSSLVEEMRGGGDGLFGRESSTGLGLAARRMSLAGESGSPKPVWSDLLDVLWACLLAVFLLVVVLGIVQSQDEYTFTLKPV